MQERLNRLYEQYGYRKFKMSRFEDYDLYAQNRDFLRQDRIITFTDADGALKALKPDITLSIMKNNSGKKPFSGRSLSCLNSCGSMISVLRMWRTTVPASSERWMRVIGHWLTQRRSLPC